MNYYLCFEDHVQREDSINGPYESEEAAYAIAKRMHETDLDMGYEEIKDYDEWCEEYLVIVRSEEYLKEYDPDLLQHAELSDWSFNHQPGT